jgi:hypothetical protein
MTFDANPDDVVFASFGAFATSLGAGIVFCGDPIVMVKGMSKKARRAVFNIVPPEIFRYYF